MNRRYRERIQKLLIGGSIIRASQQRKMTFTVSVFPSAKIFCAKERTIIWIIHIRKIKKTEQERISETYEKNREELHRTFAGVLYEADFSTDRPSPWNLNRISQSLYYAAREREAGTSSTGQENKNNNKTD